MVKIEVALARIEERQISMANEIQRIQDSNDHKHANTKMAMENFVPRREIDAGFAKLSDKIDASNKRIEDLEADRKKVTMALLSSAATMVLSILGFVLKKVGLF